MTFSYAPDCCDLLRRHGYRCEIVEHYNQRRQRSSDLFGFGDVLAYRPSLFSDGPSILDLSTPQPTGSLIIQACAISSTSPHLQKVVTPPTGDLLRDWLFCGNRFEIWSFPPFGHRDRLARLHDLRGRAYRQTAIRFLQLSHDGTQFFTDETTELILHGYTISPRPSRRTRSTLSTH